MKMEGNPVYSSSLFYIRFISTRHERLQRREDNKMSYSH